MSKITITDNLLSQYLVDMTTLSIEELQAVESYLTERPDESEIMSHILEAMNDEECEPDFLNISNAEGLFDGFEEVSYSTNTIAQELIADIMQECSEQELFERFERECAEQLLYCQNLFLNHHTALHTHAQSAQIAPARYTPA